MKYTIHGYSQEKSIESGLDYLDLGILRWIQDFYPAMKKTIFQNKEYGWFSYSYFLNELPIIGINTKAGLRKRIDKIIEKGFIDRTCIKDADDKLGTRSWIRLTEKMLIIISQTTVSTGSNHSFHPVTTTVSTGSNHSFHNSSINNPSINNSSISIDKNTQDTASGFSQNDFLESFIKNHLSEMSESARAGFHAFVVTQLESLSEKLNRPLTQSECLAHCKKVIDGMQHQNENPVINVSLTTQNPTRDKLSRNEKPKKEIDFPQEFVEIYEGYEGKHPLKQIARATKIFSKWKNACKTRTNAEILIAVEFYAKYIELTKETWKNGVGQQKKKLEFWLTSDYEINWAEKYNEEKI